MSTKTYTFHPERLKTKTKIILAFLAIVSIAGLWALQQKINLAGAQQWRNRQRLSDWQEEHDRLAQRAYDIMNKPNLKYEIQPSDNPDEMMAHGTQQTADYFEAKKQLDDFDKKHPSVKNNPVLMP